MNYSEFVQKLSSLAELESSGQADVVLVEETSWGVVFQDGPESPMWSAIWLRPSDGKFVLLQDISWNGEFDPEARFEEDDDATESDSLDDVLSPLVAIWRENNPGLSPPWEEKKPVFFDRMVRALGAQIISMEDLMWREGWTSHLDINADYSRIAISQDGRTTIWEDAEHEVTYLLLLPAEGEEETTQIILSV